LVQNQVVFQSPKGLTIGENSYLYVCDYFNNRIQIFSNTNFIFTFTQEFGKLGFNDGEFMRPFSIHYNEKIIYVGDEYCLQLFTSNGTCLQRIGDTKWGNKDGQFREITGICVIKDEVFVSDKVNQRVQVFKRI